VSLTGRCCHCRAPRPLDQLLLVWPAESSPADAARRRFVCRPSLAGERNQGECFRWSTASADRERIAVATEVAA
jgi:hypothetical protein